MKEYFIHKFHLNGNYFVLDIPSGSVHAVEEIVFDIIDDSYYFNFEDLTEKYKYKFSTADIKRAFDEINELRENGLLFSSEVNLKKLDSHEHVIKAMCLHLSHDCNLKCKYCFASQGNFKGERMLMPLETGKKALLFLVKKSGNRKNLEVDFFGGEPLMNFQVLKELVDYGRELEEEYSKHFRFTVTTNGVLLNDEIIDYINENMDNVVLSLDGRKTVNDNMRKTLNDSGSYDIIVPKFKRLISKRGNKDYYIRGTFTSENLDFSKDILDFYRQGFKKVSVEPVVTEPSEPYAIKKEHLPKILSEYEEFSKEYINIKKQDNSFLFFHFMIDLTQGPCIYKRVLGCGAGTEYVAITPEGDIYPCHQFVGNEEFKLGNLETDIENFETVLRFKEANVLNKETCGDCWAKYYCSGGCHANAYFQNKNMMIPFDLGCEMEKKRIECAISVMAALSN